MFHVGMGLLPQFVLRALQKASFDYLRVDIALLHKVPGKITTAHIQHDMAAAHSQATSAHSPPAGRAFYAPYPDAPWSGGPSTAPPPAPVHPAAPSPSVQVCFNFRDKGKCRYGDSCKFQHPAPAKQGSTGVCVVCSSPQHGINQCPVHKQRQLDKRKAGSARAEKANLAMTQLTDEVAALRALVKEPANIPAVDGAAQAEIRRLHAQLASSYQQNPYYSFGPNSAPP
jgi:hypothetical protein